MEVINYTKFRENLTNSIDFVNNNHRPLLITRGSKKPVVMLSLEDYNAFQETNYLLGTENNRKRLLKGVEDLKNSNFKTRELIDED